MAKALAVDQITLEAVHAEAVGTQPATAVATAAAPETMPKASPSEPSQPHRTHERVEVDLSLRSYVGVFLSVLAAWTIVSVVQHLVSTRTSTGSASTSGPAASAVAVDASTDSADPVNPLDAGPTALASFVDASVDSAASIDAKDASTERQRHGDAGRDGHRR
jgi:hypothetical protein